MTVEVRTGRGLALLLALLGMLGPFSVDTYLPAFEGMARSLHASPLQLQQTLSAYLFGFAFMNLFHGALSDSFGRRPVVLVGVGLFTLASVGCALSTNIEMLIACRALQGLSTGAGIVVSRTIVRDVFPPDQAQKVMAQITIYFGVAPAVAPIVGAWLYVRAGWPAVFWLLAALGSLLWLANWRFLPETLSPAKRQAFDTRHLLRGYAQLALNRRFLALCLASGVPFNGMFLYVLAAPHFLGDLLGLSPTEYWKFFVLNMGGIVSGAWASGRMAGRVTPRHQVRLGFVLMLAAALANVGVNWHGVPPLLAALVPIALFSFGWAMTVPVVTLMALDVVPARRGMASSLQACLGSVANGLVAGVLAPWLMHSTLALATGSLAMVCLGLGAWVGMPGLGGEQSCALEGDKNDPST